MFRIQDDQYIRHYEDHSDVLMLLFGHFAMTVDSWTLFHIETNIVVQSRFLFRNSNNYCYLCPQPEDVRFRLRAILDRIEVPVPVQEYRLNWGKYGF